MVVQELLDAPGEWFLDETSHTLLLWPNDTDTADIDTSSSPSLRLFGAVMDTVLLINATQSSPATNLSFAGIGFGFTSPTYLRPHERPLSGDWALHRGGAVHVTNAHHVDFQNCRWVRTGGQLTLHHPVHHLVSPISPTLLLALA